MGDYGHELQFGVFLTPDSGSADRLLELAGLAEVLGLDLVTVQDHPYQARFLDTWTLLSVIAARTSSVRVAPNVANLPLRQPVVLARSVATLDILSGGRVELGLGAGAFWDAIAAIGGPRLTPGESVDALGEAIEVIRAVWDAGGGAIRHEGRHYRVVGAHRGPAPRHRVELWLGAYKPRMLALTGARADGWLPSMGYAEPDELPAMNDAIDRAAVDAGRAPVEIRRLYNLNGSFGGGGGFLRGAPEEWVEQLAGLTAQAGISTFLLAADDEETMRRFATEVVPAVARSGRVGATGRAGASGAGGSVRGSAGRLGRDGRDAVHGHADARRWDAAQRGGAMGGEHAAGRTAAGPRAALHARAARRRASPCRCARRAARRARPAARDPRAGRDGRRRPGCAALVLQPHDDPPEPLDAGRLL
jgi:alkanesulfonate monooxygenase SsuD/methylene tetrahydromethanopterin reductase-like flavin-dependent oxidoreductase (luciferase family)